MYMPVMDGKTIRDMPDKGSGWVVGRAVSYTDGTVRINGDAHVYNKRCGQASVNVVKWGEVHQVWFLPTDTKQPFPTYGGYAIVE